MYMRGLIWRVSPLFFAILSCKSNSDGQKGQEQELGVDPSFLTEAVGCSKKGSTIESPNAGFLTILGGGNLLHYQREGNDVRSIWKSNTSGQVSSNATYPCEEQQTQDALYSANSKFRLTISDEGNLVVSQAGIGTIWESRSSANPGELKADACEGGSALCSKNQDFKLSLYYNGTYSMVFLSRYDAGAKEWLPFWQSLNCRDKFPSGTVECS